MRERASLRPAAIVAATAVATATSLALSGHTTVAAPLLAAGMCVVAVLCAHSHHRTRQRNAALRARLREALTDPVTGLPVRRVAEDALTDADGTNLTVAVIDVDDMHSVNHRYGHDFGDAYLAHIAQALLDATRPVDLVARLGGDESLILTATPPQRLAADLARHVNRPVTIDGHHVMLAASVGLCPIGGGDARNATGRADRAMLRAKHERAITAVYDPARDADPPPSGTRPDRRPRDQHHRRRRRWR